MNQFAYKTIEALIERMQNSKTGIPVKNAKNFFNKIPTCFTGKSLKDWLSSHLGLEDHAEVMHVARVISCHGYIFPINEHTLTVKDDLSLYRFQTPFLWPSNNCQPDDYEYGVYLCKRTMQNKQRLELADHEAEQLARLQKLLSQKWEFVYLQAEAQAKVDRKRDRIERKVLDSQEQAYWDLYKPPPDCVKTMEADATKINKKINVATTKVSESFNLPDNLKKEIDKLHYMCQRSRVKVSKAVESYITYYCQYLPYDVFISTPSHPPNPWISDNCEHWTDLSKNKDIVESRVKKWSYGLNELLKDAVGREAFRGFLVKEFSAENLRFWEACQELKRLPLAQVNSMLVETYRLHLGKTSAEPVNLDGHVLETINSRIEENPSDRYCLEEAQESIFLLMKRDSYVRFMKQDLMLHDNQRYKNKKKASSVRSSNIALLRRN